MHNIFTSMLMFAKCHSHVIASQKRKSRTYGDVIGCKINVSRSHGNVIHWQINVSYSYVHLIAWQTVYHIVMKITSMKREFYQWRSIIPPISTKWEKINQPSDICWQINILVSISCSHCLNILHNVFIAMSFLVRYIKLLWPYCRFADIACYWLSWSHQILQ